jgi:hypothetical protein
MRILIVSPTIPYPLSNGGNVAQFSMLNYLQNRIDIDYCCVVWSTEQQERVDALKKEFPKINFIVFNQISTETKKTSSTFLHFYKRLILFLGAKTSKKTKNNSKSIDEFKKKHTAILHLKTEEYIQELQNLLAQDSWDIIQTEFSEMIELITLFPKKAKTIFVSHESKTLRMESAKRYSTVNDGYKDYLIQLNKHIEVSFLNKYDTVIVFSDDDKMRLRDFGVENIKVSPFSIIINENATVVSNQYNKLIFLGGSNHYPNVQGLNWFIENIFPSIYEKYKIPLIIVGHWDENLTSKYKEGAIKYVGFVENLESIFKNAILIVPMRIGNGIRTKILLGLKMKVPILSTSLGFEGLNLIDFENIFAADTAAEFIDKMHFIKNAEINQIDEVLENGWRFFEENYNAELLGEIRLNIYKNLLNI